MQAKSEYRGKKGLKGKKGKRQPYTLSVLPQPEQPDPADLNQREPEVPEPPMAGESSGSSSLDRILSLVPSPPSVISLPNSRGRSPTSSRAQSRAPSEREGSYSPPRGIVTPPIRSARFSSPTASPTRNFTFASRRPAAAPPSRDARLGGYMEQRRALLDIIKDLHSTGIQNELDLPQIVVIGSQSVGKSSLIEAMSGLDLPRDNGTCTRCPMECRLQNATIWSCKIKLRFQYTSSGQPLHDMREVDFGDTLYDKRQVEDMIRRAQRAILRPSLDASYFLDDTDLMTEGYPALTFSKNCVCIHVSGPNIPDLYFYDLPGLIANVGDEGDEADIRLVENLAKEYIKRPNCIVLLVIACTMDFENQGAGNLVLRDEKLKQRTIGVLTKVDRIELGASDRWLRILRNERNALRKGWYCVKLRDPLQLEAGTKWEDAQESEREFFRTTSPWMNLDPRYQQRLGSENLADRLGSTLSELVSTELPNIRRHVDQQLGQVAQQLQAIPVPNIPDPRGEIVMLLRNFTKTLSKHIEGLPPTVTSTAQSNTTATGLLHALHIAYDKFREKVHHTAPQFKPWSTQTTITASLMAELIKSAKEDDDAVGLGTICDLHLDEVADLAKRSRTRELPGNYPFSVKANLVQESTERWRALAQECFKEVAEILIKHVDILIDEFFKKYAHGGLKAAVLRVAHAKIAESAKYTMDKIEGLCRGEDEAYTQNEQYFLGYRAKLVRRYKMIHQQSLGQNVVVTKLQNHNPSYSNGTNEWNYINNIIQNLSYIGINGVVAQDLTRLLPEADLQPALEIMAEVRAYFQVAYKRFGDNVPRQIDTGFVRRVDDDLNIALMSMDFSTSNCLTWLKEPLAISQKRKELSGKQKRLESAKNRLVEYYAAQTRASRSRDDDDLPDMPPSAVPPSAAFALPSWMSVRVPAVPEGESDGIQVLPSL